MKGTKGAQIINGLKPSSSNDHIIHERTYSAFDKTVLLHCLKTILPLGCARLSGSPGPSQVHPV